ncbi:hypothetical protein V502_11203 [Pseudogymnoascus sp. VKM F-4520 (FW-2644)]|nr:hypothetical protein V502_11203 [Pseudogymnoascus sp. VKM F-4520 (FW-2644)]
MHPTMDRHDRHDRPRPCSCDYYDDDTYYEDRYAKNPDDGYSYHKTRLYNPSQRHRANYYYYNDDPYLPSHSTYYRHSYRTRDEPFTPPFFEEEYHTPRLMDEYTGPVGWFYEHLISRTGRVVTATTVRLWSGLRRTAVLDHRERRTRGLGM